MVMCNNALVYVNIQASLLAVPTMRHLGCRAGRRRISAGQVLAQHPAEELTPKEFENKLASVAEKENWAPSKFNRYRSLVSLSHRLRISSETLRKIQQRVKTPKPFGLHNFLAKLHAKYSEAFRSSTVIN